MLLVVPNGKVKLLNALPFAPADLRRDSLEQAWHAYRDAWRTAEVREFIGRCRTEPRLLRHANETWPMGRRTRPANYVDATSLTIPIDWRMGPLTPANRRELRAKAHHLHPVVTIGHNGLTPAVLHEIDLALLNHELLKIRVFADARDDREALLARICAEMEWAAVQHLGKVLVVWRPNPEVKKPAPPKREPKAATRSGAKRPKAPKTGARTPLDPVRERRRGVQTAATTVGKGTRGAARFNAFPERAPLPARRLRDADGAPPAKRKSSFTPKTKPRSFSAKPNPREAWAKKPRRAAANRQAGPHAAGARLDTAERHPASARRDGGGVDGIAVGALGFPASCGETRGAGNLTGDAGRAAFGNSRSARPRVGADAADSVMAA